MTHIIIKNIGPIKEVELDLNKINVFMGPQSSGKSTIAKIICHCQWVEKQCYGNARELGYFTKNNVFYSGLVRYHRLDNYFNSKSRILFTGDYLHITYNHQTKKTTIRPTETYRYSYPKITYIPSERNFVAAIPNLNKYNESNDVVMYFIYDWFSAKKTIKELTLNPILENNIKFSFKRDEDYINIGKNRKGILLRDSSSGLQSLTPLMMVLKHSLCDIYNESRTMSYDQENIVQKYLEDLNEQRNAAAHMDVSVYIAKMYLREHVNVFKDLSIPRPQNIIECYDDVNSKVKNAFQYHNTMITVEEPEQNLFPHTQAKLMNWLVNIIQESNRNHTLTITTHSPYILFSLNNCMMGGLVKDNISDDDKKIFASYKSWIDPKKVSIYEIHDGALKNIQDEDGIIEDNYLNQAYKENSSEYLNLLNYFENED